MGKRILKAKSKRTPLRTKYLIKKKSKDSKKKNGKLHKKFKDPGLPQCVPFLAEEIKEAQETRERMKNVEKGAMIQRYKNVAKRNAQSKTSTGVDSLPAQARVFNVPFKNQLSKVLGECHIVCMLLDARNPESCRSPAIENMVLEKGKKLIFVLNKIDLVPRVNAEQWLAYLRQFHPTVPFKCNLQKQASNLKRRPGKFKKASEAIIKKTSSSFGVNEIMSLLNKTSGAGALPDKVMVGVVGLPNTGKSAFINTMKHSHICASSPMAGLTRKCQVVILSKNLSLVDSPGIFLAANKIGERELVLRNCIKLEDIQDINGSAAYIIEHLLKCDAKEYLKEKYCVGDFASGNQFVVALAQRYGLLRKGGIFDVERSSKKLIQDWRDGELSFHTEPPFLDEINANDVIEIRATLSSTTLNGIFQNDDHKQKSCTLPNDKALCSDVTEFEVLDDDEVDSSSDMDTK